MVWREELKEGATMLIICVGSIRPVFCSSLEDITSTGDTVSTLERTCADRDPTTTNPESVWTFSTSNTFKVTGLLPTETLLDWLS